MRAAYESLLLSCRIPMNAECPLWIASMKSWKTRCRDETPALARRLKEAKICLPNARPDTIDFSIERGRTKQNRRIAYDEMDGRAQNIIITGAAGYWENLLSLCLIESGLHKRQNSKGCKSTLAAEPNGNITPELLKPTSRSSRRWKHWSSCAGQLGDRPAWSWSRQSLLEIINEGTCMQAQSLLAFYP